MAGQIIDRELLNLNSPQYNACIASLGASSNPSYLMPRQLGETLAMWAIWLALLVISWLHKLQNITARISSSCYNSSHELFHIINPVMFFFRIRRAPTKAFAGYTKSGGCVGLMTRTSVRALFAYKILHFVRLWTIAPPWHWSRDEL